LTPHFTSDNWRVNQTARGIAVTNTSIQYVSSARPGEVVISHASLVHCGHSTQVWDATVSSKSTNKTLAVVQSCALNKYNKENSDDRSNNNNNNQNDNTKAMGGDSRQWLDEKLNKIGTNFNIDTMSKQEIAAKFDKHAPHWYANSCNYVTMVIIFESYSALSIYRQDLVHKFHYKMLDWVTQQAKTFANKNAEILGAYHTLRGKASSINMFRSLDAACAVGLISDALRKGGMTGRMTGTDISPKMLELAQQRGNYSHTFVHDLELPLPCPDRSVSALKIVSHLK